jgi:hypothetical protein
VLGCVPAPVVDEDVDAGYWRARAERAEMLVAELRADKAGLTERVAELAGQLARLQESVTTLSGLLFGSSSEKGGSPSPGNGRDSSHRPGGTGKRGQRPGRPGHGRRDYYLPLIKRCSGGWVNRGGRAGVRTRSPASRG